VSASATSTVVTLTANSPYTGLNTITLARSSSVLTVSGTTLTGASQTKAPMGWTKPYAANGAGISGPALIQTTATVTGSSLTGSFAGSPQAGDLILGVVYSYDSGGTGIFANSSNFFTGILYDSHDPQSLGPGGVNFGRSNRERVQVWYRWAVGTENVFGWAIGFNGAITSAMCTIFSMRGFNGVIGDALPQIAAVVSSAGSSVAIPAVNCAQGDMVIEVAALSLGDTTQRTLTTPANYTNNVNGFYSAGNMQLVVNSRSGVSAGAVPTQAELLNTATANSNLGLTIVLRAPQYSASVYRQPASNQMYLQVDDSAPSSGRDGRMWGFESMSGYGVSPTGVGLGSFPAYPAATAIFRKSETADSTARPWMIYADDRTFFVFVQTGVAAGVWTLSCYFGDIYSQTPSDPYKVLLLGSAAEAVGATGQAQMFNYRGVTSTTSATAHPGKFMSRSAAGFAGPRQMFLSSFGSVAGGSIFTQFVYPTQTTSWLMKTPNPTDGATYVGWVRVHDWTTYVANGTVEYRGRLRGLVDLPLLNTQFSDGDTFSGASAGPLAGKTYRATVTVNTSVSFGMAIETSNTWDTST
jgi:hypothetical protein